MKWMKKLNGDPLSWLLESQPWTRYRTLVDLQDKPLQATEVLEAYEAMVSHQTISLFVRWILFLKMNGVVFP
jgi:hypothetical protein